MDSSAFYDVDSILENYINDVIQKDPELRAKMEACKTEEEMAELQEYIITRDIDADNLPKDVEAFLSDEIMATEPQNHRLYTVEYNEFKEPDEMLLFEYIPARQTFEDKKTIFSMIGYLYRILTQNYKPEDEKYPIIEEFLNSIFVHNPEKYYKELEKIDKARVKFDDNKILGDFDLLQDVPELVKILHTPPAVEQIKNIHKYKSVFNNEIRELTSQFYQEHPGLEGVILPHGNFKNMEAVERFCKTYNNKFRSSPIFVKFRQPTLLSDYFANKQRCLIYSKNDEHQIVNSIFERQRQEHELAEKILQNRSNKQVQKLSPEDMALLHKYNSVRKDLLNVSSRTDEENIKLSETETKIENIKSKMIPEGTQPITIKDLTTNKESVILTEF